MFKILVYIQFLNLKNKLIKYVLSSPLIKKETEALRGSTSSQMDLTSGKAEIQIR